VLIPSGTERASEPTSCYYLSKICFCVPVLGLLPARHLAPAPGLLLRKGTGLSEHESNDLPECRGCSKAAQDYG
jgi:hypothetical protein